MRTGRLTNIALYEQYLHLCMENVRSAGYHLDDQTKQIWFNRLLNLIHFMQKLGYGLSTDHGVLNVRFVPGRYYAEPQDHRYSDDPTYGRFSL